MSIFHMILKDRPFVMFVVSLVLAFLSLVFSEFWMLAVSVIIGFVAHFLEKREGKNAKDSA